MKQCHAMEHFLLPVLTFLSLHSIDSLSRSAFLTSLFVVQSQIALAPPLSSPSSANQEDGVTDNNDNDDDVVLPLRWLPTAGCLAVSVLVNNEFLYNAVVDTGSPFLTAPPELLTASPKATLADAKSHEKEYPSSTFTTTTTTTSTTMEQYGETLAPITWRKTRRPVLLGGVLYIPSPCRLGIISEGLRRDTGGLFCGLIAVDDARPTLLQQMKRQSFTIDYVQRTLTLHAKAQLLLSREKTRQHVFNLFDLSPFGPDLYHYAILVKEMTIQTSQGAVVKLNNCTRPIVAVIDTGLTGCILSDSFVSDGCLGDNLPISSIQGVRLHIDNGKNNNHGKDDDDEEEEETVLTSHAKYWNLACFRLPWFNNHTNHPHIVAAGATFLQYSCITVDASQRRMRLRNRQAS